MKKKAKVVIIGMCFLLFCCVIPAFAEKYTDTVGNSTDIKDRIDGDEENLVTCYARESGVKFLCNPNWKMKVVDQNSTVITISSKPFVTMAISRVDAKISFLEQLTKDFFKQRKLYLDNFQKDRVPFAQGDAIQLKAFSQIEPDMRYLGYFYIHDSKLNSVFFAVYPKENWEDYKFFIKKIRDSFSRI